MARLVCIGASVGGVEALEVVLGTLPLHLPFPVVAVLHRAHDSSRHLVSLVKRAAAIPVSEVGDKQPMRNGHVYLAPPDYHLLVDEELRSHLSTEGPVQGSRPSIDVLFHSAAVSLASEVTAVVLTGGSDDGAAGAAAVYARGGRVVIEDPEHAHDSTMPCAAIEQVPLAAVVQLPDISGWLLKTLATTGAS